MEKENIHKNHRERMRGKYKKYGADIFETHQLMEMLLFHSMRQGDTNPAAHNLLKVAPYGAFGGVSCEKLCEADGIGENSATLLKISSDTSVRILCDKLKTYLGSEFSRKMFMWLWFRNKGPKTVAVLLLDHKDRFVDCAVLATGKTVRPENYKDTVLSMLENNSAVKVVLAHNHQNGVTTPSPEDLFMTDYLKRHLESERYCLLDHYVITDTDCVSCFAFKAMQE